MDAALSGEAPEEDKPLEITIQPDVIVVGAGMAGLVASVHAVSYTHLRRWRRCGGPMSPPRQTL